MVSDPVAKQIEPADPPVTRASLGSDLAHVRSLGFQAIRDGKGSRILLTPCVVAVLVLAGGQGTRLGYDHPKGMYDIGLPTKRSIFEVLCRRFLRAQEYCISQFSSDLACEQLGEKMVAPRCHMYFMTSPINDAETKGFFAENHNFGVDPAKLHFFAQGVLPSLDLDGKIIMEKAARISLTPNGNGGIFAYLLEAESKFFPEMQSHGVEYLQIIGVDNVLNRLLDPVQVGLAVSRDAGCVIKTIPKARILPVDPCP